MTQKYQGGCHCGAVRYEIDADISHVVACNCSICARQGWLLAFMPVTQFTLISGADAVTDYQFGKKRIHHPFCTTCGTHAFGKGTDNEGKEVRYINVRCLDDVDVSTLSVSHYDGKKL